MVECKPKIFSFYQPHMNGKKPLFARQLGPFFRQPATSAIFLLLIFYPLLTALAATTTPTLAETEAAVRAYFVDTPAMIAIAQCESGFRQFNNDGTPLRANKPYVGVFQIDEKIHAAPARDLGLDLDTLDGNLGYAKHLYEQAGTRPWAGCVKNANATVASRPSPTLTRNLKMGTTNPQVAVLQQLLNNAGFTIAKSGPGSPGKETATFGSMTRAAVRRFQCEKNIVCQGTETTTGYGFVGPRTRALLLTL